MVNEVRRALVSRARSITGVYGIFNIKDDRKPYVGSAAKSIGQRWGAHLDLLRKGTNPNVYLQRAWNKYEEDAFVFEVIEVCNPSDCIVREQHWIDTLRAFGYGYNMCEKAGSRFGATLSENTKEKISVANSEKIVSTETRQRMSESHKGVTPSSESVEMMVENHWSRGEDAEEISERIAEAHRGTIFSKERKNNISKGKLGKTIPEEEVVGRYTGGESISALSDMFLVDRDVIKRILVQNNVRLRSHQEACNLRKRVIT